MADSFVPVTFVADELLTSTKMNLLAANQAGFHDGTALGDGIIVTRHVGTNQITENKTAIKSSYSNSEIDTGKKWVDGKSIYRRASAATTLSTLVTAVGTISNIDKVISLDVMVKNTGDGGWRRIPWLFNGGAATDWQGGVYITSAGVLSFQVGAGIGSTSQSLAIIEYTKI